ncbi:non-homologous end-joining DNA ligase [Verrucomicrobiota bacterium sgz303538]
MSLREYQQKRDFGRTAEPPPQTSRSKKAAWSFVVQKHDASRLHYDFRLEMGGVLKSWAVPKGFPFNQGERHLAVHVEDHPIEYEKFEGIIPRGEYGGGTVMVWDLGTYEVIDDDPVRALHRGKLHLRLKGKKLRGEWTLIRTRSDEEKEHWLLLKTGESIKPVSAKRDDESVLTRRTMQQIASQQTATWRSTGESWETGRKQQTKQSEETKKSASRKKNKAVTSAAGSSGKRKHKRIGFIEPMKAKLVDEPPSHGEWIYELKWDGYRAIGIKDGQNVEIYSRNQTLLTDEFPEVREALLQLPAESAIVDGEIVALDAHGHALFQLLQARAMGRQRPPIFFYLFDLLHLDGKDVMKEPLCDRKEALEKLLRDGTDGLRFSASIEGDIRKILKEISAHGMEGVIGKLRDSVYEPGLRSGAWVKVKCGAEQEFVIGGFTDPQGTRPHLGAIHVGYYDGAEFRYAGKVGAGFDRALLEMMRGKLDRLETDTCPFTDIPTKSGGKWTRNMTPAAMRNAHWVRPEIVCQVRFAEWTSDAALRQPVFLGLRKDKDPRVVIRERPA